MSAVPVAPVALSTGVTMPPHRFGPVSRTDIVRYAGAGGDFNPMHHDEPLAIAAGLPSVFGMGMLHAGVLAMRLARWVGPGNLRTFRVRFADMVWPGDVLAFAGRVADVDAGVALLELDVRRHDGTVVLTATATAVVA